MVPGDRGAPGLAEGVVEHGEQRPGHRVGGPRVVVGEAEHRCHQGPRRREAHPGADAVAGTRRRAEPVPVAAGAPGDPYATLGLPRESLDDLLELGALRGEAAAA